MEQVETEKEQVIRGNVKRVTFRNAENGYSVLQLTVSGKEEQITVVGTALEAKVGSHLVVRGTYLEHPKFGRQFSASSITTSAPSTLEGIETYLGSGLIKGIGPGTAKRIVEKFGEQTIETVLRHPEKIAKLKGVGQKKAQLLSAAMASQQEMREIMQFLVEHHISPKLATKIYERYENKAIEVLSRDPYLLARSMKGVGFVTADTIAINLGLKPDSPQRLKAGVYYTLEKAADDGHCFLPTLDLVQRSKVLLGLGDEIDLEPHINSLIEEGYIVRQNESIYLDLLYRAEDFAARFVAERCSPFEKAEISEETVKASLRKAEEELGVTFTFEQEQAVHNATHYPLTIITGGPGCGKTTIIKALSLVFRYAGKRVLLAAPTGRAAQRMSQVCGMPACTIHRLLKFDPVKGTFLYGPNEPLLADALIIDEASMIDIQLARSLFSALQPHTSLILVGDKDQLPSVGAGRVFGDLVGVEEVKTISLSQLFRRSGESSINMIAHLINSGTVPEIPEPDGVTKVDAYFIPRRDVEEAATVIEKLVAEQIPKKFGFERSEITVLTPSNRGPLGTIALNKRLQNRINPPGALDDEQELTINDLDLRLKDRVCQRVNNYNLDETGVFNGDVGEIFQVSRRDRYVVVELWDGRLVKYENSDLYQLSLAYAVTVHRSQGSEIPCVVLALHDGHYTLLERQLIYTAVTRAKKLLVIVGSKRALAIACKRSSGSKRNTQLQARIRSQLE